MLGHYKFNLFEAYRRQKDWKAKKEIQATDY